MFVTRPVCQGYKTWVWSFYCEQPLSEIICESEQFIAINDNMETDARFLYQMDDEGEKSKRAERQKESVLETERSWKRGIAPAIK